ncbi:MAG TPA: NfeD family protein [Candidatus Thermoplasmatota archaeon]|nr:NfeD family protein [Candidatus Thermoplasmatota archaeon]
MDATTVGYGLVGLGVLLFLVEATSPGFFLGVPASILVILGVFALMAPDMAVFSTWAPLVVVVVGVPATFVTIWAYRRLAPPDAAPTTQSADNLTGQEGIVSVGVVADRPHGKVTLGHQAWSAVSAGGPIAPGARVRVVRVDGVILVVEPA